MVVALDIRYGIRGCPSVSSRVKGEKKNEVDGEEFVTMTHQYDSSNKVDGEEFVAYK